MLEFFLLCVSLTISERRPSAFSRRDLPLAFLEIEKHGWAQSIRVVILLYTFANHYFSHIDQHRGTFLTSTTVTK